MSDMYDVKTRIPKGQKHVLRDDGHLDVSTVNEEPTMAQQQFAEECDINNIMKKYASTKQFTHLTSKQGVYGDFSMITDYQDMLHTVQYAQEAFMALPAEVRKRFRNDPGELLNFIQKPENYDEALSLGLVNKRENAQTIATNDQTINANNATKTRSKKTADPSSGSTTPAES